MRWELEVERNLDRAATTGPRARAARAGIRRACRGAERDRAAPVVAGVVEVEVRRPREMRPVALERDCLVILGTLTMD